MCLKSVLVVFALSVTSLSFADDVILYYYSAPEASPVQLQSVDISTVTVDEKKEVKLICHGALTDSNNEYDRSLRDSYLAKGYQVITIDWGTYAQDVLQYASKTDVVGNVVGAAIVNMHNLKNVPLESFHIIGLSMGAHVAGYAGRYVISATSNKIGRITGLDPALRILIGLKESLTANDANFVDTIHTSFADQFGQVAFIVNGGLIQPGCSVLLPSCSHVRVAILYDESIDSNNFVAKKCGSLLEYNDGSCDGNEQAIMGANCSPGITGEYYLNTNNAPPYALG